MNKERFITLVKNPALLKAEDAPFLEEMLKEFPFFQTAHLLAARYYKASDSIHLQKRIKAAAAHITDRKVLYNLVENFEAAPNALSEKQTEQLVPDEPVLEQISKEKEQETVIEIQENETHSTEGISALEADVARVELQESEKKPEKIEPDVPVVDENAGTQQIEKETIPDGEHVLPLETYKPVIEAEIPLEREIKLALAESVYLRDFEQIVKEEATTAPQPVVQDVEEASAPLSEKPENAEKVDKVMLENEPATDFVTWLKKLKPGETATEVPTPKEQETIHPKESEKLVEAFMEKPLQRAKPVKKEFYSPVNMAKQSVTDNDFFVTETLAKIYIKQGNLAKAIKVYQNLSLKHPEKNTIFAAQIKNLKEQLHNKSGK